MKASIEVILEDYISSEDNINFLTEQLSAEVYKELINHAEYLKDFL